MCKNLSNFILPMKGVSDNNAPKKIKSKGNQSELKKPLQVLQLNKKTSINDSSKNYSPKEKPHLNDDVSHPIHQKDYELERENLNINSLEKEPQYKNAEQSNLNFNNLERPNVQNEVDKVFEEFTQAEDSTSAKFGGTGLGLSITKRLVEMMGGQVEARSQIGEGSEFSIKIPRVAPAQKN